MNMEKIARLQEILDGSSNVVFFGGAGVSTESGIPDFRSQDGLYHMKYKYPPETIISHSFFVRQPEEFYRFYKDKMLALEAEPNAAHIKLAELTENQDQEGAGAGRCWSCTDRSFATTAPAAAHFTTRNISRMRPAFRSVKSAAVP